MRFLHACQIVALMPARSTDQVLASVSPAEKAQFLVFCTASDRVPLKGWQSLGLIVQKNGVGDERLPSAYTCFSQLLLPRFSTKEKLRSGLLLAIANSEGFGLP
ncbi:HERC4 [Symbiodinium sp. CCMP2456]|nr:HERC4 [Symbiodinium sp. CCMP2456]